MIYAGLKRPANSIPAFKMVGKVSFTGLSQQHISSRNKSTGDNADNK